MIQKCPAFAAVPFVLVGFSMLCLAQENDEQRILDAAKTGQLGAVQSLLDQKTSLKAKDENGRTPLHLAAANGHQAVAETLLRSGADINTLDKQGKTPLDLAKAAGHSGLAAFLLGKGGKKSQGIAVPDPSATNLPNTAEDSGAARKLNPALKFNTAAEFEKEIGEPAVLLDSDNVCFFAPKRREKEAKIVFRYLVKAYDVLYQTVGTHTNYKMAVLAYPKGNPHGWGGTSECKIEYDDSNLDLSSQQEWTRLQSAPRLRLHRRDGPQFRRRDEGPVRLGNGRLVDRGRGIPKSRRQSDLRRQSAGHALRAKADVCPIRQEWFRFPRRFAPQPMRPDPRMDSLPSLVEIWAAFLARLLSRNPQPETGTLRRHQVGRRRQLPEFPLPDHDRLFRSAARPRAQEDAESQRNLSCDRREVAQARGPAGIGV